MSRRGGQRMRWALAAGIGLAGLAGLLLAFAVLVPSDSDRPARTAQVSAPLPSAPLANEAADALAPPTLPAASPRAIDASVPWTSLPLRLVATVVAADAGERFADVESLETLRVERLAIGDAIVALPGARVVAIERRRVRVAHRGHEGWLEMTRSAFAPAAIDPETRAFRRDLGRRILRRLEPDAPPPVRRVEGALLSDARFSIVRDEAVSFGVRLDAVEPGGLYDRLGFRAGDVVSAIDGVAPDATHALAPVVLKLASNEPFRVTLDRGGEPVDDFVVDPARLREALGAGREGAFATPDIQNPRENTP